MIEWKRVGTMREVFLVGRWAVKVPKLTRGWRNFLQGLLANMQERELFARGWPQLCPVVFSLRGGWLIVMRRAEPLTEEFFDTFDREAFAELEDGTFVPVEGKHSCYGILDGRVVAVDYGSV